MDYEMVAEYNNAKRLWEINASGEIDIFNSGEFKDEVSALIKEKPADICIDCGNLKYIDSTGLGAMVALLKSVREYGGRMTLRNVGSNMQRLLQITSLDKSFHAEG
ncbi:MAG: STAS domain-containing protein [Clostridiales bacterium]|jgi:anti-sigma B factor antagonist|nr:STAS domain-containing protein [Clostridiales bacterium]